MKNYDNIEEIRADREVIREKIVASVDSGNLAETIVEAMEHYVGAIMAVINPMKKVEAPFIIAALRQALEVLESDNKAALPVAKRGMRVLWKQVGGEPKVRSIPDTLEALQELVGGYIEVVRCMDSDELILLANEEGVLNGLDVHLVTGDYGVIFGDVVVVADDGEGDFRSLNDVEIAFAMKKLEELEI